MGEFLYFSIARGGRLMPRSKRARDWCARVARQFDVDALTVIDWANGDELIPEELVKPMADWFGGSVDDLLGLDRVPRDAIPEEYRRAVAEDRADRVAAYLPGRVGELLRDVEWGLGVDGLGAVDEPSDLVVRLQALRRGLLGFLAEPLALTLEED